MPDKEQILSGDNLERLAEIANRIRSSIDVAAMKLEADINKQIREIRKISPPLANSLEADISVARSKAQFGTGSGAYLKTQIIQPLLDKYCDKEI